MFNLYNDSLEYVHNATETVEKYLRRYKRMFYVLSVLSGIGAAAVAILTAILVSKVIWASYPEWYFFVTAGIAAITTLFSSTINYFLVKDKIHSYQRKINWIKAEEAKHHMKVGKKYQSHKRDYNLYLSVASYLDNFSAKREAQHD